MCMCLLNNSESNFDWSLLDKSLEHNCNILKYLKDTCSICFTLRIFQHFYLLMLTYMFSVCIFGLSVPSMLTKAAFIDQKYNKT